MSSWSLTSDGGVIYPHDSPPFLGLPGTFVYSDTPTNTQRTARNSELSPLFSLEDLEDSRLPVYLKDSAILHAYEQEKIKRANDALITKTRQKDETERKKFIVDHPGLNAWRENIIDKRTLYGCDEDWMEPADSSEPPVRLNAVLNLANTHLTQEREYMKTNQNKMNRKYTPRLILRHTISEYNKPVSDTIKIESYGSPRYSMNEKAPKKPNFTTVSCSNVPSGSLNPSKPGDRTRCQCGRTDFEYNAQFCEILGPASCSRCIESVNRTLASDLQREGFPQLDATVSGMVGPSLASLMVRGDKMSKRKQRLGTEQSSVLRLPTLSGKRGTKFCRAGVERQWEANARKYTAFNRE